MFAKTVGMHRTRLTRADIHAIYYNYNIINIIGLNGQITT